MLTEKELVTITIRADQILTVMTCTEIIFMIQSNLDRTLFHLPTTLLFLSGREMNDPGNKAGLWETQNLYRQFQQ